MSEKHIYKPIENIDKLSKKRNNRHTLARAGAIGVAALSLGWAAPATYDALHDDADAYPVTAHTVPNPTIGAQEAIEAMLKSKDPDKAEAASHIDVHGLAIKIAQAADTGDARNIQKDTEVRFGVEKDGDIVQVRAID